MNAISVARVLVSIPLRDVQTGWGVIFSLRQFFLALICKIEMNRAIALFNQSRFYFSPYNELREQKS